MLHEFTRTELLIGEGGLHVLSSSTVAVFGVGGVGSHCAEALARCGVGHLILVDDDTVSLTNINRQSIAYHSTVGRQKTQVMKERITDICPSIRTTTFEIFVLPENLKALMDQEAFSHVSYIVDAIDTVTAKLAIIRLAKERQIPVLSSMGTGNKLHAEQFVVDDLSNTSVCPLCRIMRRELRKQGITHLKVLYSREEPIKPAASPEPTGRRALPGSISFVPPVAGLLIAGEVVRDLLTFSGTT